MAIPRQSHYADSELRNVDGTASTTSWICPSESAGSEKILGWVNQLVTDYQKTLTSSINYQRLQEAIKVLSQGESESELRGKKDQRLSQLKFNGTKRAMSKLVAILSDIKPAWEYYTKDKDLDAQAKILTDLHKAYWAHPDTQVRKVLISLFQYVLTGEGYLRVAWENDPFRQQDFGLTLTAFSIDDVAFSQLPKDKDIQKAYATVIRHELPIATACMLYPSHAAYFTASNDSPTYFKKLKSTAKSIWGGGGNTALELSRAESMLGANGFPHSQAPLTSESTIDIFEVYVMDFSVNRTGRTVKMGVEGTSTYYEVPSEGQRVVPTSLVDGLTGLPVMREATSQDALLYPQRRRIICTSSHLISDGPSPWAHGQTPLVRFSLNDWVWDRVGDAVAMDGEYINRTIESLLKGFDDMLNRRVNPGMKVPNTWADSTVRGYDPRRPGQHQKVDPLSHNLVEPLVPHQFNMFSSLDLDYVRMLMEMRDYITGEPEIRALAQAQQVPSAETFEKFLDMAGPLTKFVALNIEAGLMEIGEMSKSLYLQFCNAARRFKVLGANGLDRHDFDFDPGTLVPQKNGQVLFAHLPTSLARIREHQRMFTFSISPGSAYQITDQARQLMMLQLYRDPKQFPLSPWSLAEVMNISIGPRPEGCKTEIECWEYWEKQKAEIGIGMQANAQLVMGAVQIELQRLAQTVQGQQMLQALLALGGNASPEGVGALMQESGAGELGGGAQPSMPSMVGNVGRPPSAQKSPQLVSKDGGTRTTISESGS